MYENERGVSEANRRSGLVRQDLFITTTVWNTDHGCDACLRACDASLGLLGLDYVDLHHVPWPAPGTGELVDDPVLASIGDCDGKSAAPVMFCWHLELGNVVLPKSVTSARIREKCDELTSSTSRRRAHGFAGPSRDSLSRSSALITVARSVVYQKGGRLARSAPA